MSLTESPVTRAGILRVGAMDCVILILAGAQTSCQPNQLLFHCWAFVDELCQTEEAISLNQEHIVLPLTHEDIWKSTDKRYLRVRARSGRPKAQNPEFI